jgi:nucleoside diphosphate kinase
VIDRLRQLQSAELSRDKITQFYVQGLLGLVEFPQLTDINEALTSAEMKSLIENGHITFAMIKPMLEESSVLGDHQKDHEIATTITQEINSPLEVVFQASFVFTDEMIEEFYGGPPKENQMKVPPIDPNRYGQEHATRWDEFAALMKQGPVTGVILYSENGSAVEEWRNQLGNHWDINRVKEIQPESIRARFGLSNHNNLVHGSDSPESAQREINFFARALQQLSPEKLTPEESVEIEENIPLPTV